MTFPLRMLEISSYLYVLKEHQQWPFAWNCSFWLNKCSEFNIRSCLLHKLTRTFAWSPSQKEIPFSACTLLIFFFSPPFGLFLCMCMSVPLPAIAVCTWNCIMAHVPPSPNLRWTRAEEAEGMCFTAVIINTSSLSHEESTHLPHFMTSEA